VLNLISLETVNGCYRTLDNGKTLCTCTSEYNHPDVLQLAQKFGHGAKS
jgi:hypothetical protein